MYQKQKQILSVLECKGLMMLANGKGLPCYLGLAPPLRVKLKLIKPLCLIKLLAYY